MTTLKTPEQIEKKYLDKNPIYRTSLQMVITQDRKHTAQALCDLLEGLIQCEHAVNTNHECKNCNADEHPYGADTSYNKGIRKAQAFIRQTLDPISSNES